MKVERAVLREIPLTLARPFRSSAGTVTHRRVLLLTLEADGVTGWAECVAPVTPHYAYETVETAWHVLADFVLPRVVGIEVSEPDGVLDACADVRGHPMAKAAVEMAAWDAAAKSTGVSLATLLGGSRSTVPVGVSLGMEADPQALGDVVERHLEDGYRRVKVKIEPGRDVDVLAALRERFSDVELWGDANSAYGTEDALASLEALDGLGLGLLEEPIAPGDLVAYARLQERLSTPLCLDESVGSVGDATAALELGSCRALNLKPGRVGGHAASLRICELLASSDVSVWCGGMLETGVGRAHNVALASLPAFTLPGDISASRRYWERDIVSPEFEVAEGEIGVPTGPGIGVEVDVERVEALTTRVEEFR